MAKFRVETVVDPKSGLVYAELYHEGETVPFESTAPVFPSHEVAEATVLDIMRQAFSQPITDIKRER